jgi:hypothetical protein
MPRKRQFDYHVSFVIFALLFLPVRAGAQAKPNQEAAEEGKLHASRELRHLHSADESGTHRFADRTNLGLFAGVAAVRALDYTSTRHFRALGRDEILFNNSVADNKPLFLAVEAAGVAVHVALASWLHTTGHHRLERWLSIVHIGVGIAGDLRNYRLDPLTPPPPPQR